MTSDTLKPSGGSPSPGARKNVEDVLPLLDNQLALVLFSGQRGDEDPGFLQVRFSLEGRLDEDRFAEAWRLVIERHPALRTSIHEREGGHPLAVVRRTVPVPIEVRDWRSLESDARAEALETMLEEDRRQGLDFSVAPAMRIAAILVDDTLTEVVWTCHHILIDGWSSAIVLEDLMEVYHQLGDGSAPPEGQRHDGTLRSFVQWMTNRDSTSTREFWRDRLDGFTGAEPLLIDTDARTEHSEYAAHTVDLPDDLTNRLRELASASSVTPNTIMQAAWSVVAALLTAEDAPVFGTTVSGRTAPVDGVERLVGYLSNAVPVRISVEPDRPIDTWLQHIRNQQFEMQPHEHATLDDIRRWTSVPGHRRLFETFLVVENFPLSDNHATELRLSGFRSGLTTAFPVTVAVGMGDPWFIHLRYDTRRVSIRGAEAITDQFVAVLEAMAQRQDRALSDILDTAGDRLSALRATASSDDDRPIIEPRTDEERALLTIWTGLLDRQHLGITDDWFEIGGSSLAAVGLFEAIAEQFGLVLPLNTLLARPTIEALGQLLADRTSPPDDRRSLVAIHTEGTRPPIIGIHGGGGEVLFYRSLWERLGPDQPMYALEPLGLDGITEPLESVPAMATRYIDELLDVQPSGPYQLIGFCFGGVVALEMAARLEAAGETVSLVAVIDGGLPLEAARAESTIARAVAVYRTRGVIGAARAARDRMANRGQVWWDGSFGGEDGRQSAVYAGVAQACRRAFSSYEPTPISAPIVLIRSTQDQPAEGGDWHLGWDEYTPNFTQAVIDGPHSHLFEPPTVDDLAAIIDAHTVPPQET